MRGNKDKLYKLVSFLMQYPDNVFLQSISELESHTDRIPWAHAQNRLKAFLSYLKSKPLIRLQENYTAVFVINPSTTLNMTYHLLGDGEKRAGMMVHLRQLYLDVGYDCADSELPDFLPLMLEFAAVCPNGINVDLINRCLAEAEPLADRLRKMESPYSLLLDILADEWKDPAAAKQAYEEGGPSAATSDCRLSKVSFRSDLEAR